MPLFEKKHNSEISRARAGFMHIQGHEISTPVFMPVGTRGTVRAVPMRDMRTLGYKLILGNTYHLIDRPGAEYISESGGLHAWAGWDGGILTDSGGYQVYSLADVRSCSEDGVEFASVTDGRALRFTPESVFEAQAMFGSDIAMVLDECPALPASRETIEKSVDRTDRWAKRTYDVWNTAGKPNALFGIVQGGTDIELRKKSLEQIISYDFSGFALGGLAVGEKEEERTTILEAFADMLPADKPRYLMGVGYPEDIVVAVRNGIDMFDCVIPTREARHGRLYRFSESGTGTYLWGEIWYEKIPIKNNQWKHDASEFKTPLWSVRYDYLRYLHMIDEPVAQYYTSVINLHFYYQLMEKVREAILAGEL